MDGVGRQPAATIKRTRLCVPRTPSEDLSFLKTPSTWIRAMRQNQRIMLRDVYIPSAAWDVCRQPVQVAAPARSRESLSPPSAQYCAEGCTAPSTTSWE